MTDFQSVPVQVNEDGTAPPVVDETAVNQYLRDLHRQRQEHARIVESYRLEIDRLKAERDDLAQAPLRKVEMLEQALTVWHQERLAEDKAAGLPDKKWRKSIKLPSGTLSSTAGRKSTEVPAEDSEDYVEFFRWVEKHAPEVITFVPASSRVDLSALKKAVEVDEETGELYHATWDKETGELVEKSVAPGAKILTGDRTFKQA